VHTGKVIVDNTIIASTVRTVALPDSWERVCGDKALHPSLPAAHRRPNRHHQYRDVIPRTYDYSYYRIKAAGPDPPRGCLTQNLRFNRQPETG
jgi:hypothetical protein